MESVRHTILTHLCRTDDERMASSPKNSADRLDAFGQPSRQVSTVIGHPVVDHVIGVRGIPVVQLLARNKSNVREPVPPLQLGADTPELLCLLLRKGRI